MVGELVVSTTLAIPDVELRERFSRSSGPGGQGVNTTDSRVELSFDVAASPTLSPQQRDRIVDRMASRLVDGVLTVAASEFRSQRANRQAARARLAGLLLAGLTPPPPPRRKTRPSRAARERRLADKARRSAIKQTRRATTD